MRLSAQRELEGFDPARRERFVEQAERIARQQHPWLARAAQWAPVGLLAALAGPAILLVIGSSRSIRGSPSLLFLAGGFTVFIAASVVLPLTMWMIGLWSRSAVRALIRRPRCSQCGYSLAGLEGTASMIRCPECGSEEVRYVSPPTEPIASVPAVGTLTPPGVAGAAAADACEVRVVCGSGVRRRSATLLNTPAPASPRDRTGAPSAATGTRGRPCP